MISPSDPSVLQAGQVELKDLTAASLDKLQQGHQALHDKQGALWAGQGQLESSLKVNLEQLGQEKALIASGQELVARLIQDITHRMGKQNGTRSRGNTLEKCLMLRCRSLCSSAFCVPLESVSDQLKGQGSEVQEGHQAIIEDLADVRDRAQDIYHKIGQ